MGVTTVQQTTTSPTPAQATSKVVRPGLLNPSGRGASFRSTSGRGISYRSKSGRTLTFEFAPSSNIKGATDDLSKLTALASLTPAKVTAKAKDLSLPQQSELIVKSSKSPASINDNAGMLVGIYESISFWCMEAVEVACWGPYDEVPGK